MVIQPSHPHPADFGFEVLFHRQKKKNCFLTGVGQGNHLSSECMTCFWDRVTRNGPVNYLQPHPEAAGYTSVVEDTKTLANYPLDLPLTPPNRSVSQAATNLSMDVVC